MSEVICPACEKPIEDGKYIYMWFSEKKKMLKVHSFHIQGKRKKVSDQHQG